MLTLPIKKRWFDMILSGEKKEEYRDITPYYKVRFKNLWDNRYIGKRKIMFRNGYSMNSPSFIGECELNIGYGKPEWGAKEGKNYYVLTICRIMNVKNECIRR